MQTYICRVTWKDSEAARIITGIISNFSRLYLYREPGWEPLHLRRTKHKLHLMYKIVSGLASD